MLASSAGQDRIVSILLEEGADPNLRKLSGVTAVFLASAGGHTALLEPLIRAGAGLEEASSLVSTASQSHEDIMLVIQDLVHQISCGRIEEILKYLVYFHTSS